MENQRKMVDSGVDWIGEVPERWKTERLTDLFTHVKEVNNGMKETNRLALTMNGVIPRKLDDDEGLQTSNFEGYQIFEARDLAFKLIDLQNIKTSRVGRVPTRGIMSPAYIRLCPKARTNTNFYYYQLYSAYELNVFNDMGGGVRQTLGKTELLRFQVTSPCRKTQKLVVDFLDHHVDLIDRERELIAEKIGLLKDKRKALIFECVTGKRTIVEAQHLAGVDEWSDIVGSGPLVAVPTPGKDDPFVKGGRLVDSGVEWIGEVPEGWRTERLTDLFTHAKEVNHGMKEANRLALTMSGVIPRKLDDNEGLQTSDFEGYQIFEAGDLAFKLIDLQNIKTSRVGRVPARGIMSPAYIRLCPKVRTNTDFYYYQLYSAYELNVFNDMGGGVRQTLGKTELLRFQVTSPCRKIQKLIVDFLDTESGLINQEIRLLETKSSLLADKRKALIFEAVTGKLDCTHP